MGAIFTADQNVFIDVDDGTEIPDHAIESLARCLLPHIQKFYESEEGQRAFEEWKAERE